MKKVFALILALVMVFAMSSVAFATTIESGTSGNPNGADDWAPYKDVKVNISNASIIYNVDIEWESMTFTYNKTAGTWNPVSHTYDGNPGWQDDDATITVTNHSNAAVTATATFAGDATVVTKFGVTATITGSKRIETADQDSYKEDADSDGKADSAPYTVFTVTVTNEPNEDYNAEQNVVGTITVKINAA